MDALQPFVDLVQGVWQVGFLVFLRVGTAMTFLPAFGEQMIPLRIRLAIALAFSTIIYPMVSGHYDPVLGNGMLYLAGIEITAGLVFGFAVRLFVHILQIAGSIASQSVSLSQILGPTGIDPVPALGQILVLGGLALALLLGLHVKIVQYLILTYELIPPGRMPLSERFTQWGIGRVSHAFGLAFALSAPFILASLVYNLALGVINRAMPQLMVAFVGAPAITAGGLILLFVASPLILQVWATALFAFMHMPDGGF